MIYNKTLMGLYGQTNDAGLKGIFEGINNLVESNLLEPTEADSTLENAIRQLNLPEVESYFSRKANLAAIQDLGITEIVEELGSDVNSRYINGYMQGLKSISALLESGVPQYKAAGPMLSFMDRYEKMVPAIKEVRATFESALGRHSSHIYCKQAIDELMAIDQAMYTRVIKLLEACFSLPANNVKRYISSNLTNYASLPTIKALMEKLKYVDNSDQSASFTRFAPEVQVTKRYSPIYRMRDGNIRFVLENRVYESDGNTIIQLDRFTPVDQDFINLCNASRILEHKGGRMVVNSNKGFDISISESAVLISGTECKSVSEAGMVVGGDLANTLFYLKDNLASIQPVSKSIKSGRLVADIMSVGEDYYVNVYDPETQDNKFLGSMDEDDIVAYLDNLMGIDVSPVFVEIVDKEAADEAADEMQGDIKDEIEAIEDEIEELEKEREELLGAIGDVGPEVELVEMRDINQAKLRAKVAQRNRMILEVRAKRAVDSINLAKMLEGKYNDMSARMGEDVYHGKVLESKFTTSFGVDFSLRLTAKYDGRGFLPIYEVNPVTPGIDSLLVKAYEEARITCDISEDGYLILNGTPANDLSQVSASIKAVADIVAESVDDDTVRWKFLDYQEEMGDQDAVTKLSAEMGISPEELLTILTDADITVEEGLLDKIKKGFEKAKKSALDADSKLDAILSSKVIVSPDYPGKQAGMVMEVHSYAAGIVSCTAGGERMKLHEKYVKVG